MTWFMQFLTSNLSTKLVIFGQVGNIRANFDLPQAVFVSYGCKATFTDLWKLMRNFSTFSLACLQILQKDKSVIWIPIFSKPNQAFHYYFHYTRRITPKHVTSLRCPSLCHWAKATQLYLRRCWSGAGESFPTLWLRVIFYVIVNFCVTLVSSDRRKVAACLRETLKIF